MSAALKPIVRIAALMAIVIVLGWGVVARAQPNKRRVSTGTTMIKKPVQPGDVLKFTMKDIDGKDVDLKDYLGKVVMIVNVASKCGYTPQYKGLEALYEKYKDQGFVILAFPSNEFKEQEPGSNAEIKKFCTDKYKVTFPLFEKVQVKEPNSACDLYKFLTDKAKNPKYGGDIKWNFTKFLIDRKGEIRARFEPKVEPESKLVTAKIETLLGKSAEKKSDTKTAKSDKDTKKDKAKGG